MIPDMETNLTDGRKVMVLLDNYGRAFIAGEDTYLRYNRETRTINADPARQEGEFVSLDSDGDFVVWKPPARYSLN